MVYSLTNILKVLKKKAGVLIGCTFAVPVVFLVRLISPWVLIRFGPIRTDVLGHFLLDSELYLSEKELEYSKAIDCFYFQTSILPNGQWALMVRRNLRVNHLISYIDRANHIIPGWEKHFVRLIPEDSGSRDPRGLRAQIKPQINFTHEEDLRGIQFLEKLGLNAGDRFVCLHVRDSAYKEKHQSWHGSDWSRHDYRNSDIDTYEEAALALAEKDYWVFRMGKAVNKPFKADHSRILDYSSADYRSDFLDIWLIANCFFIISTSSGLDAVADNFRRPIVLVNHLPVGDFRPYYTKSPECLELFKRLKLKSTGKYLSLTKQINSGAIRFLKSKYFTENGIEIVDNTSQEIKETVLEMEMLLNGTWRDSHADLELQYRFLSLLKEWVDFNKYLGKGRVRIATSFLRKNHEWFLK